MVKTITKHIGEGFSGGELYDVCKWINGMPCSATISVGTETDNVINVAIQLTDYLGNDLTNAASILAYCASDSAGLNIITKTFSTETAIGTDGSLGIILAKTMYQLTSEADGDIDLDFTDTGTNSCYLALVMPNGKLVVSDAITFTV